MILAVLDVHSRVKHRRHLSLVRTNVKRLFYSMWPERERVSERNQCFMYVFGTKPLLWWMFPTTSYFFSTFLRICLRCFVTGRNVNEWGSYFNWFRYPLFQSPKRAVHDKWAHCACTIQKKILFAQHLFYSFDAGSSISLMRSMANSKNFRMHK